MNTTTIAYEQIRAANEAITAADIKGKLYAPVNQRIKAFRMVHPLGRIVTDMIQNDADMCVFRCTVYDADMKTLATGTAYEKPNSTYINKTSYIENCETSAVGRALGFAGFGIDMSIASKEEVENANKQAEDIQRRERDEIRRKADELEVVPEDEAGLPITPVQRFCLENLLEAYGVPVAFALAHFKGVKKIEDLTQSQGVVMKTNIERIKSNYERKEK